MYWICQLHFYNLFYLIMEKKPFDIHFIIGNDNTGKEVANLNIYFQLKSQNIPKLCEMGGLKQPVGDDMILKFDFTTQQGRQKECIQYFQSGLDKDDNQRFDHDLSPLQNWFQRPKKSGKLQIYQSTSSSEGRGQITLQYRFYKQQLQSDSDIVQTKQQFLKSSFHPDLNLTMSFYGDVHTYKKNRVKIKLDYIEAHLTSNQFKMKDVQNLSSLFRLFGDEDESEEMLNHPLFKFVENTEEIQLKLKMASIRKMLRLYEIGLTEENTMKSKKREYPEIIKGLFKEEVRVTMVYGNFLGFIAKYNYKSQAVLIRMLTGVKKYSRYFQ